MTVHLLGFWTGMLTHLWQTTLVLLPIFLLDRMMRGASGAVRHGLWTLALVKFLVPFSVLNGTVQGLLRPLSAGPATSDAITALPTVAVISAVVDPARRFGLGDLAAGAIPAWGLIGLSVLWSGVVLHMLGRLACEIRAGCRWQGEPLSVLSGDERIRVEDLLARSRWPFDAVRLTAHGVVPSVIGLLRPRLVVPRHLLGTLPAHDLHAILLHERAHGTRPDPLRTTLQRLLLAAFFFYPPVWLVLRRLRETAEFACDESVVQAGIAPADYGRALARVLSLGLEPMGRWAAAAGEGGSLLRRRLRNLASGSLGRPRAAHKVMLACAVLLVAGGLIVPLPTLAVDDGHGLVTPIERARLDRAPQVLSTATPAYPARARTEGVEGHVYLDLRVTESGNVDSVRVTRGVENYPEFGEAAMKAAQKWRFTPGERGGIPVTAWVTVPLHFTLAPPEEPMTDRAPPTLAARAGAAGSLPPPPPAPAGMRSPPSLDTAPVLMEHRSPAYPARARNDHVEGVVALHLRVSAEGVVDSAYVRTGVDGYPEFAEAALGAARGWRFTPGNRDGQPVTVWVYCPVRFRLDASLNDMAPTSSAAPERA